MNGVEMLSEVKPVMWISSLQEQALMGASAIVCRLYDEGELAVLEVEESDQNLKAIGGEDLLPGVHWSSMMEIQNGRRVTVSRKNIVTKNDIMTLQTVSDDRRRDVGRIIDEEEAIERSIESMERVAEALEQRMTRVEDNVWSPSQSPIAGRALQSPGTTRDISGGDFRKLEETTIGDYAKSPTLKPKRRSASPDHLKKVRLRSLAEAAVKQKQHPVSPASSEQMLSGSASFGPIENSSTKVIVNMVDTPGSLKDRLQQQMVIYGDKGMSRIKGNGRKSPGVKSSDGKVTMKLNSKSETMQPRIKDKSDVLGFGNKQTPTIAQSVMLKRFGVKTVDKPVKKLSVGKSVPLSAASVTSSVQSATTAKKITVPRK